MPLHNGPPKNRTLRKECQFLIPMLAGLGYENECDSTLFCFTRVKLQLVGNHRVFVLTNTEIKIYNGILRKLDTAWILWEYRVT